MFILYAIPIGLLGGWLAGGRLERLSSVPFAWAWLAMAGLLVQVVLFSGLVEDLDDGLGAAVYVASTAAVLVAVVRNVRLAGMPLVMAGAAANLLAIVANGGVMPTTVDALRAAGLDPTDGFSNSAVVADPAVAPLTDVFALPPWVPLANVFSVGDVLIAIGVALVIALGMRAPEPPRD
ncbi:MAG: DUF5317 domain-containing protein [Candidatus Limnocylindria bacterium]